MRRQRPRLGPWLLVLVGIAGMLGIYWYFNPQQAPSLVAEYLPVAPQAETRLFRWRDDQGQWVFSDQAPPAGIEYELVSYRHDTNTVPAYKED